MSISVTAAGDTSITMSQAVINMVESIALQEAALGRILNAESEKMQKAIALEGLDICKLLEVNDAATNMVHAVANMELILKDKLELIANSFYYPSTGDGEEQSTAE